MIRSPRPGPPPIDAPAPAPPSSPFAEMRLSLKGYWDRAPGYRRLAFLTGAALIAVGLVHAVLWAVVGGPVDGPVSWRKPVTFGVSFGLTAVTLGWAASYLPVRPWTGWVMSGLLCASTTAEVVWVTVQHARGVPAHFNGATPLDDALFTGGGVAIAVTIFVIVAMTVGAFVRTTAPPPIALALRTGLPMLLVAQGVGAWMILHGLALMDAGGTPLTQSMSTYGTAGAMKFAHAVPMHAIQVIGALAWLLTFTRLATPRRTALVGLAAAGYAGLCGVAVLRTAAGLAPFAPLDLPAVLGYAAPGVLLAVPTVCAVAGLTRRHRVRRPEIPTERTDEIPTPEVR